jgi:hypothetical protein
VSELIVKGFWIVSSFAIAKPEAMTLESLQEIPTLRKKRAARLSLSKLPLQAEFDTTNESYVCAGSIKIEFDDKKIYCLVPNGDVPLGHPLEELQQRCFSNTAFAGEHEALWSTGARLKQYLLERFDLA